MVSFLPLLAVIQEVTVLYWHGLAEVDHPDASVSLGVVYEQQRAANDLQSYQYKLYKGFFETPLVDKASSTDVPHETAKEHYRH